MRSKFFISVAILISLLLPQLHAAESVNLATKAEARASSRYGNGYSACYAVDGQIPQLECKFDVMQAWCVKGAQGKFGMFTLTWEKPVEIAEVVYFGRTGQIVQECFKDYEMFLDDSPWPVARGAFEMRHGPQRVAIKKTFVKKLRICFYSAHKGALNPGASEIAVFSSPASDTQLNQMMFPLEGITEASKQLRSKLLSGEMGFRDILLVKRHPLNISHVYVYHVEGYRPGGGLYIYTPGKAGEKTRCILDSSKGMITTADLSYDGKKIVFAWKKGGIEKCRPVDHIEDIDRSVPRNNYQIYTINIDGTDLKQLTTGKSNNLDPCWLPDGGIAFISDRKPAYAYCYVVTSPVVYRMDADGKNQKRLSANYLMDFTPSVLNDGTIIYTRWEYVDRAACPIQSLWTIHPDGTGLTGYYGNRVLNPGTFMDAQPIPGTNNVIATATNHNGPCRGGIVMIDPSKGANAKESLTNLTPEVDIYRARGQYGNGMLGPYEKPFPVDKNTYLVSNNGKLQVRSFAGDHATLLLQDQGLGYYSPQPIRKVKTPPVIVGTPRDMTAKFAQDGSVSGSWATVFMRDVYNGLTPHVKRGTIKKIAVVQEIEKSTHSPQNNICLDVKEIRLIAGKVDACGLVAFVMTFDAIPIEHRLDNLIVTKSDSSPLRFG